MSQPAYLYIISDRSNSMIYTGVTEDLKQKIHEFKIQSQGQAKTDDSSIKLVYYEKHLSLKHALKREAELQRVDKQRKFAMIKKFNPEWKDLYAEIRQYEFFC